MPNERPEMPHTQTSAPAEPPDTTRDVPEREDAAERTRRAEAERTRRAGEERDVRGDRMPAGADEPGAGI